MFLSVACPANCDKCSSSTVCTKCSVGYVPSDEGICVGESSSIILPQVSLTFLLFKCLLFKLLKYLQVYIWHDTEMEA